MKQPRATDEEIGRQILTLYLQHRIRPYGVLRRVDFFSVRDGDFRRGMDYVLAYKWVELHRSDRHRYILTQTGFDEVNSVLVPASSLSSEPIRIKNAQDR